MKRIQSLTKWVAIVALLSLCPPAWAAEDSTPPVAEVTAPAGSAPAVDLPGPTSAPAAESSVAKAASLRVAGIHEALRGEFQGASRQIEEAARLNGDDGQAARAARLLKAYLALEALGEEQREKEYAAAVERVRRSMLAEAYRPKLVEKGVMKKIEEKILEVAKSYNRAGRSDSLDLAGAQEVPELQARSAKALDAACKSLEQAIALLADDESEYGAAFRQSAGALKSQLESYKNAWQDLDVKTPLARSEGARRLKTIEERMVDATSDVESLSDKEPWRVGMQNAQLAKRIASAKDKPAEQSWYRGLLKDLEARGKKAVEEAKWYEALSAYSGLQDLEEDNETYKETVKNIRRHVRVLGLYGGGSKAALAAGEMDDDESPEAAPAGKEPEPETQPATDPAEESESDWHDLVAGVDADMVKNAIAQVSENYVTPVDFRKLTRSGLMSLKVLADTPQAAHSFKLLADPKKKAAFLEAIDTELKNLEADRADQLTADYALNAVISASEGTVQIPTGVVCVEFADGLLDELDPFSTMIWPYEVTDFQKQTMGQFYGVGIQITKEPGEPLRVVTPLADSPAFRAGVRTGDIILTVDGRRTEEIVLDKLVRMITGERGTKVQLRIKRQGLLEPIDVSLIREEINIKTIKGWRCLSGGDWDFMIDPENKIGYVRMTQFTEKTAPDFEEALATLRKQGMKSLILDLRFDPGGLLHSATDVADEFLTFGRIVSTKGRRSHQDVDAQPDGTYKQGDLVVLVNGQSASASEILSGALKDWGRAIIVGERSYGKGSVQNVIPLRLHKAVLKLTTAYYYLPSGRLLHRKNGAKVWGVDPDVVVLPTLKQTRHWVDLRRKADMLTEVDPKVQAGDLQDELNSDLQLNTAVLLLQLKQLEDHTPMTQAAVSAKYEAEAASGK